VLVERRVVLLSRDPGLISITGRLLLSNGDRIVHFRSAAEVSDWSTPVVAAVVLDSQPRARRLSYKQVRDRYDGPLVMLLDKGERRPDLPPDGARQFLHRPFRVAELSKLLGAPGPGLGQFEAAIIAAWSRHATAEQAARARRGPSYRINWRPSLRRRARAWAATVVALMGLLLVFGLSDQGSCAPACTSIGGGGVAGASESGTPLTAPPGGSGGGSGGGGGARPPGLSGASSQPPTPAGGGLPVVVGVGGLIDSISPITSDDTTPPTGPQAVPGVPAAPGADPPPATSPPPTTTPPGTGPPTTGPPTTGPPTTGPPTTDPPTTDPPTTGPPTTDPPTTDPPTTQPPPTDPPTTAPPPTDPPPTDPPTTAPPPTDPPTTAAPPTEAPATEPPTTPASPTP
jgi:hypothetical protein